MVNVNGKQREKHKGIWIVVILIVTLNFVSALSEVSLVSTFTVSSQDGNPKGIFFKPDGFKMYVAGDSNDAIYEYDLTTAWQINTSIYNQSFSVNSWETAPKGLFFKPDGTKMYIIGSASDVVKEFNLSVPWDVSSAVYHQSSINAGDIYPESVFFDASGTKMYTAGWLGKEINQFSLSTAWDVSSASYVRRVFFSDLNPKGAFFNPGGDKMYVVSDSPDIFLEYNLSTPGDISSASYIENINMIDLHPMDLYIKADETKLYVVGSGANKIYEYALSSVSSDNEYPQFSDYWDDGFTIDDSGTGHFNVTVTSTNGSVFLDINGVNYSASNLTESVYNVNVNLTSGNYSYYWGAYGNGTLKNYNNSVTRYYVVEDTINPSISIVYPQNNTISSNSGLNVNYTASDDNLDSCWYSNDTMSLNTTLVNCVNLTKVIWAEGQHNVTIWANDSAGNENSSLISFTIAIPPSITINSPSTIENVTNLQAVLNATISELGSIWYNLNNLDNVSLCSNCTNANITLNFIDYGNQTIIVYANDSFGNENNAQFNFTLNLDSDGDGDPDSSDTDDDDDGIPDWEDKLNGHLGNINTNINDLNLIINNSINLSQKFRGGLTVGFNRGGVILARFNYNFSANQTLNLAHIVINKQKDNSNGAILVKGINLADGETKTLYIDNLNAGKNSVCVKNSEIDSIEDISSTCSENDEVRCLCNGVAHSGFTCTDLGARYRILGLTHSGIIETIDAIIGGGETPSGGGGGGGGGGFCFYDINFDWNCSEWDECVDGIQARGCEEYNNCGTIFGKPNETRACGAEEAEIPAQLFDISLSLENSLIQTSDELSAIVVFENFGAEPTPVELTYIILDEFENEIYREEDSITVEVEEVLRKSFEGLNLAEGKYILVLHTLYNVDVEDEFRQEFEISRGRIGITGKVIDWTLNNSKKYGIAVSAIILIILIVGLITWVIIKIFKALKSLKVSNIFKGFRGFKIRKKPSKVSNVFSWFRDFKIEKKKKFKKVAKKVKYFDKETEKPRGKKVIKGRERRKKKPVEKHKKFYKRGIRWFTRKKHPELKHEIKEIKAEHKINTRLNRREVK